MSTEDEISGINLADAQRLVLKFLAENGAANAYQIQRNTGMRYSTVHKAVKDLQQRQFIVLFAETKNPKGVTAKSYRLTLKGLLAALAVGADLKKAAKNWAWLLPLILGKLEYFESWGLTDNIRAFLVEEAKRCKDVVYDEWDDELARYEVMAHLRNEIFRPFVLEEKDVVWLKAVRDDPELKQWAIEALKHEISIVEALRRLFKCQLEAIESTEEPNWFKVAENLNRLQNALLTHK